MDTNGVLHSAHVATTDMHFASSTSQLSADAAPHCKACTHLVLIGPRQAPRRPGSGGLLKRRVPGALGAGPPLGAGRLAEPRRRAPGKEVTAESYI